MLLVIQTSHTHTRSLFLSFSLSLSLSFSPSRPLSLSPSLPPCVCVSLNEILEIYGSEEMNGEYFTCIELSQEPGVLMVIQTPLPSSLSLSLSLSLCVCLSHQNPGSLWVRGNEGEYFTFTALSPEPGLLMVIQTSLSLSKRREIASDK